MGTGSHFSLGVSSLISDAAAAVCADAGADKPGNNVRAAAVVSPTTNRRVSRMIGIPFRAGGIQS